MKKLFTLTMIVLIAGTASSQTKIAYVRIDDIVGLMPELSPQKINMDTIGQQYIKDSLLPRMNYVQQEYQRKVQDYQDTSKPKVVRDQILKELMNFKQELDGYEGQTQQVLQFKQQDFLRPFYLKARNAIQTVAKEKGYTHVVSTEIFLMAPEADDISLPVLAKLNIKVPPKSTMPPNTNKRP